MFLAVYVPAAGLGFVLDDFGWVLSARARGLFDLGRILATADGFYRPAVTLTFTINEWLFGAHARGYGLTNVGLALGCAAAIVRLARELKLPPGAAWLAAMLWLLNFHGINMAVLWISGRTALMLTLAAVLCASALVLGRVWSALLWLAVALLSKEEAVVLPLTLAAWLHIRGRFGEQGRIRPLHWLAAGAAVAIAYLAVRSWAGAMTPASAPYYYRFTVDPGVLWKNALEYADRALTFSTAVTILAAGVLRARVRLKPDTAVPPAVASGFGRTSPVLLCAAVWIIGGYAVTMFLPVRSSLYACLPSVGACLAAAALCARMWEQADPRRRRHAIVAAAVLPFLLAPAYVARTRRSVALSTFSARALDDLARVTAGLPDGAEVVVHDDPANRVNVAGAFGALLNPAFTVHTGRRLSFWIEPPMPDAALAGLQPPCATCVDLEAVVENGRIVRRP